MNCNLISSSSVLFSTNPCTTAPPGRTSKRQRFPRLPQASLGSRIQPRLANGQGQVHASIVLPNQQLCLRCHVLLAASSGQLIVWLVSRKLASGSHSDTATTYNYHHVFAIYTLPLPSEIWKTWIYFLYSSACNNYREWSWSLPSACLFCCFLLLLCTYTICETLPVPGCKTTLSFCSTLFTYLTKPTQILSVSANTGVTIDCNWAVPDM